MYKNIRRLSAFLILTFTFTIQAAVVINEVDYDQPGSDTAEFIELYNNGAVAVDLSTYTLEFINGSNNSNYRSLALSGMLAADGYLVICATIANVPNCTIDAGADNLIQNGAPDALGLMDGMTLVDAVSYEGNVPGFSEGTTAPTDNGGTGNDDLSISRFPNGSDTNINGTDFVFQAITPGATNGGAPAASISIDDVTQVEGNAGTTTFDFTVSIDVAANATVQVDTADVTATTADSDYVAIAAQTVTFTAAGALTQTVSVTVNGDTAIEADETFQVNLSNVMGATIADNQGIGTISNDDVAMISIDDVTQAEGDAGTTTFDFTVSIDTAANATVQVDTADNTATTADSDYVAIAAQTVTFTAGGATSQTVSVTVNGDTTIEGDETFNVNLSMPMGAAIADNQGVGTITNDDNTQAILSAVKSVSGDLSPGGLIAYDIVITNSGPNPQNDNVGDEMTDTVPASMVVQSVTATSGTATNVGNVVSWNGSVPAMGSVTVTINAQIDAGAAGNIENQAQVFYDNDGDNTNESNALSSPPMGMGPAPTAFFIPFKVPSLNLYGLMLLGLIFLGFAYKRKIS